MSSLLIAVAAEGLVVLGLFVLFVVYMRVIL